MLFKMVLRNCLFDHLKEICEASDKPSRSSPHKPSQMTSMLCIRQYRVLIRR
jgi:hypothetical protein